MPDVPFGGSIYVPKTDDVPTQLQIPRSCQSKSLAMFGFVGIIEAADSSFNHAVGNQINTDTNFPRMFLLCVSG